jgi:hypothetical protein
MAVTRAEHLALHAAVTHEHNTSPEQRAHLESIRGKAAEWHRSEEGRAWHREHGRLAMQQRTARTYQCIECQSEFPSIVFGIKPDAAGRFCSPRCCNRYHVRAGTFLKQRQCQICQKAFRSPAKRETCSRECGARLRWDRAKGISKR